MSALIHVCGGCSQVVPANGGYLGVRHGDITSAETPGSVRWEVWHFACDPQPEDGYQIGTEQIATREALDYWSRHLSRKAWLPLTDWDQLMAETADGTGTRIITPARAA
jgi:hypothetical protein